MSEAAELDTSPLDWSRIETGLDARGFAAIPELLTSRECRSIAAMYADDNHFRSRIVMARHGFGRGEYKYFAYPLPDRVAELRADLYPGLARVANRWNTQMGIDVGLPATHAEFLRRCHDAGQTRPTPLLLRYVEGDYNCLHQDCTASTCSRSRSPSCCRHRAATLPAASSSSPNSDPGCSHAPPSSRCPSATPWYSPCSIAQFAANAALTVSTCATA